MYRIEEKFKQLTIRTKVIILAFVFGLCLAWVFRYSAPFDLGSGVILITDRWTGCVTYHVLGSDKKPYKSCP